jgi:sterol desaturase/sphingolipid hydroxylase (fatty acid hydroxylase superfamily)
MRVDFGKRAGVVSGVLGALSVLGVLCFRFPHHLVYADARPFYVAHIGFFRGLLLWTLVVTIALAIASLLALRSKLHGALGLLLAATAFLLGGPSAEAVTDSPVAVAAALDYFILSLLLLGLIFVPMERMWPLRQQKIFRSGWQTDLTHFFANHVLIQVLAFISIIPVQLAFSAMVDGPIQRAIASQPFWLQFLEILLAVDLTSYWVHRAFHRLPLLWRFHAVHHSVEEMDWLAGSRLHLVDTVVTRLFGFLPIFLAGFSSAAVFAYVIFVSFHAVYIHANVSHEWPLLRRIITTPEFHHWHHAAEEEAVDKNFAVLLSFIDSIFGTAYRPGRWPSRYGVIGAPPPPTFIGQLIDPFRKR